MDFDLETLENIMKEEKKKKSKHKKKKHRRHSSRSSEERSRSRRKPKKKSKSRRDYSRDDSKKRKHRSRREDSNESDNLRKRKERKIRRRSEEEEEARNNALRGPDIIDKEYIEEENEDIRKDRELKMIKQQIEDARRLEEEARREDNTVIVTSLPSKADEQSIYVAFTKCGKIRDIRVIRDPRSYKSKGIAYVEFYYPDSVIQAVNNSGKIEVLGRKTTVAPSQAEKNRAAQTAKKNEKNNAPVASKGGGNSSKLQRSIHISNISPKIGDINETDIKSLFEPFGEIELVDIHRDPNTGRCKGFVFVQYCREEDARVAIDKMNGYIIAGQPLKVTFLEQGMSSMVDTSAVDLDEEGSNYIQTPQSRALLIQKLSRAEKIGFSGRRPLGEGVEAMVSARSDISSTSTSVIILSNMFNLTDVDLSSDPKFFSEIRDEVKDECAKYGSVDNVIVESGSEGHIWVKLRNEKDSRNTHDTLKNKIFNGRQILCTYGKEDSYQKLVNSQS